MPMNVEDFLKSIYIYIFILLTEKFLKFSINMSGQFKYTVYYCMSLQLEIILACLLKYVVMLNMIIFIR